MKKLSLFAFLFLILLTNSIFGQAQELSATAKHLESKVTEGNYDAILEAGNSGDLSLIPYLKKLASNTKARNNSNAPAFQAHIALAMLGDNEALQQILADIDANDPDVQDNGMKKLSIVGGDEAFKKFYQLLDDAAPRENPDCKKNAQKFVENNKDKNCGLCCDVIFFPRNSMAIYYLSGMVDNPPTERFVPGTEKNISIWKEWFKINKPYIQ